MIPKELVELLFINFCINTFHMQEAWKIKLFFAKSSLIKGTNSSIFVLRGLFFNNSHSDMGILYFNNLNVSIKVWYIYTGDGEITSSFHLKAVWYVLIGFFVQSYVGYKFSSPSTGLIVFGMVKTKFLTKK